MEGRGRGVREEALCALLCCGLGWLGLGCVLLLTRCVPSALRVIREAAAPSILTAYLLRLCNSQVVEGGQVTALAVIVSGGVVRPGGAGACLKGRVRV